MARKFGLELEFEGDLSLTTDKLQAAGLCSGRTNYSAFSQTHWVAKTDGSVHSGGEIVSPPLMFDDPEQRGQIKRVVDIMRDDAECYASEQAGIHVHIDGSDLDPANVQYLIRLWTKYEDIILRIATSGWEGLRSGGRTYCKPLEEVQVQSLTANNITTLLELAQAWNGPGWNSAYGFDGHNGGTDIGTRYRGLNLQSYFHRRTVEFRIFNSSMNPERINAYVAMCMALMDAAKAGAKRTSIAPERILKPGAMLAKAVDGERDIDFESTVFQRFLRFLKTDGNLSREDARLLRDCWADSVPQPAFS